MVRSMQSTASSMGKSRDASLETGGTIDSTSHANS